MEFKPRWLSLTSRLVLALILSLQIHPAAIAADSNSDSARRSVESPKAQAPIPLPIRSVRLLPFPTSPTPRATLPSGRTKVPPQAGSKGSSKKWIWILAAVGGGVAAGLALRGGDDDPSEQPEPNITIGAPTVGAPQ